jgi:hypothetical protein
MRIDIMIKKIFVSRTFWISFHVIFLSIFYTQNVCSAEHYYINFDSENYTISFSNEINAQTYRDFVNKYSIDRSCFGFVNEYCSILILHRANNISIFTAFDYSDFPRKAIFYGDIISNSQNIKVSKNYLRSDVKLCHYYNNQKQLTRIETLKNDIYISDFTNIDSNLTRMKSVNYISGISETNYVYKFDLNSDISTEIKGYCVTTFSSTRKTTTIYDSLLFNATMMKREKSYDFFEIKRGDSWDYEKIVCYSRNGHDYDYIIYFSSGKYFSEVDKIEFYDGSNIEFTISYYRNSNDDTYIKRITKDNRQCNKDELEYFIDRIFSDSMMRVLYALYQKIN